MIESIAVDVETLGRDAAQHVADLGFVELITVVAEEDWLDRPIYRFDYLIDRGIDWKRAGLIRTRLAQKLRDELTALGDVHHPSIQIVSQADLSNRISA